MYVPADNALGLLVPQSSEYPGVPPEIVSDALPSKNPLQVASVVVDKTVMPDGSVITKVSNNIQEFASVT